VTAGLLPVDGDGLAAAVGGFLKGQDHAGLDVVTLARRIGVGPAGTAEPAKAAKTAAAKDIAEKIPQVHTAEPAAKAAGPAALLGCVVGVYAGKAELVVPLALFGVGQYVVGLVDLLELFLGLFVAGVQVRVVFLGKLAVCAFDLVVAGIFANAQDLVVITFFCHSITPFHSLFPPARCRAPQSRPSDWLGRARMAAAAAPRPLYITPQRPPSGKIPAAASG